MLVEDFIDAVARCRREVAPYFEIAFLRKAGAVSHVLRVLALEIDGRSHHQFRDLPHEIDEGLHFVAREDVLLSYDVAAVDVNLDNAVGASFEAGAILLLDTNVLCHPHLRPPLFNNFRKASQAFWTSTRTTFSTSVVSLSGNGNLCWISMGYRRPLRFRSQPPISGSGWVPAAALFTKRWQCQGSLPCA